MNAGPSGTPGAARGRSARALRAACWGLALLILAPGSSARAGAPSAERLVLCDSCHGAGGEPPAQGVPSLSGQPARFLVDQLALFRSGERRSAVMQPIVLAVGGDEDTGLAEHYARRRAPPRPAPADPALFARGRAIARNRVCGACHGSRFRGRDRVPRLAGQREDYLRAALEAYRDERRASPSRVMNAAAEKLPDEHILALAYFLSRSP